MDPTANELDWGDGRRLRIPTPARLDNQAERRRPTQLGARRADHSPRHPVPISHLAKGGDPDQCIDRRGQNICTCVLRCTNNRRDEMSEPIKVGDRFEWVGHECKWLTAGKAYAVTKVIPGGPAEVYTETDYGERLSQQLTWSTIHNLWRRLPSSQPEKVERPMPDRTGLWRDNYGFDWRTQQTLTGLEFRYEGSKAEPCSDAVWGNYEPSVSFGPYTLISTGEAEKPAACGRTWEGGRAPCVGPKGHAGFCSNVEGMKWKMPEKPAEPEPGVSSFRYYGNESEDRRIAADMQAHNDRFLDEQKAAILANYEAQKREPAYQPHWQRTGVQTYSRRAPK